MTIRSTTVRGKPDDPFLRHVGDRPYFYRTVTLAPGESATIEVVYDVPRAADVEDGTLTYRLDVDPQGMVTPPQAAVRCSAPKGYESPGPRGLAARTGGSPSSPPTPLPDSRAGGRRDAASAASRG